MNRDVTQEQDIAKAIDFTVEQHSKLDILFNNAGGSVGAPLDEISQAHIDYGVHLLLSSVILGTRYSAIAPMKAAGGGCIINNSSIAGLRYRQGDPLYSALKAAVTHFKNVRHRIRTHNICVNAISPGAIATPIFWGGSGREISSVMKITLAKWKNSKPTWRALYP